MTEDSIEKTNTVPIHIAIIPDGNRRWASARSLPAAMGHKAGADRFKQIVRAAYLKGVKYITFYAFSTENWKRSESEVEGLMKLLGYFLSNFEKELGEDKDKIKIAVIGDRSKLSDDLNLMIDNVEKATEDNEGIVVNIAINYGSRDELVSAVKIIADSVKNELIDVSDIDEEMISDSLNTKGIPEPDLLIRTSGEERISNFLLWQIAYSELYFCDCYWPDFDEAELDKAIEEYSRRKRRFGK